MQTINQQKRIVIALVTFFIIIVSISTYFVLDFIKKNALNRIESTLEVVVNMSEKSSIALLNKRIKDSIQLASNPDIINLTKTLIVEQHNNTLVPEIDSIQILRSIVIPQLREFDEIGFGIVTKNQMIVAGLRDNYIGININTIVENIFPDKIETLFQGENIIIPPIFVDLVDNEINENQTHISTLMFAATPIFDENNSIIAAFFLSFNPMVHFSAITELTNLGDTGESFVFDKDGILISKTRFYTKKSHLIDTNEKVAKSPRIKITDPSHLKPHPINNTQNLPLTYMAEQATAKINGINMQGYHNYKGEIVFGAWRWIDSLGVGVAVEVTEKEGMQFFQLIEKVILAVVVTCFLLVIIMLRIIHSVQIKSHAQLKKANAKLEDRVNKRTSELIQAQEELLSLNKELESLAITDGLTLLPNRRFFDLTLEQEWQRCLRDNKSLAIILFDIDHFKLYNDYYGHVTGDTCLQKIGKMLSNQTFAKRPSDVIARYGGEEFVVLLSNATPEYTKQVADNICKHVNALGITHEKTSVKDKVITVSVGACITSQLEQLTPSQLIEFADQALYKAKNNGRNNSIEMMYDENQNLAKF